MATLTISDAARRCGVARRTLQRAIRAGRLALTPDHRVTLDALQRAGYVAATAPQGRVAATPQAPQGDTSQETTQVMTQELSQVVSPLVERLDKVITLLETLCHTLGHQHAAATPNAAATPQGAPQVMPQRSAVSQAPSQAHTYDPARAFTRIQALRAEGLSLAQIAAQLNTEEIPTRRGRPWLKGMVGWFLQHYGNRQ